MRTFAVALVFAALFASPAAAQRKGALELGYDLGFVYQDYDSPGGFASSHLVLVGAPQPSEFLGASMLRFGQYLTDRGELETRVGFLFADTDGFNFMNLGIGLDYLYNFSTERSHPYIRGGGRLSVLDDGDETDTQAGLDGGFGFKSGIGDRLAMRYELGVARMFESDRLAHTDLSFAIGLSFFTK